MPSRSRLFCVPLFALGLCSVSFAGPIAATRPAVRVAHDGLRKLSWQLAVPSGTFSDLTVFQAIDVLHGFGVHHLELTPGQRFSDDIPATRSGQVPSREATAALLAKLKAAKMDIVSYGPADYGHDEAATRAALAFAKSIKAKVVILTPDAGDLARLDAAATQAGVTLAVRGGGESLRTAEAVAAAIAGRSARVVGCDDTGEWDRLGIDPLAATQAMGHRVGIVRLRGDQAGKLSTTQPPEANDAAVLSTLKQIGFKGIVTLDCVPHVDSNDTSRFIAAMNTLSDTITRLASER